MTRLTQVLLVILIIVFIGAVGVGAYYLGIVKNNPASTSESSQKDLTQNPNGPYYHQIYAATSQDGLLWQKQNKLLFDHASVPGAVSREGIIYLYFVDASSTGDQLSVAVSKDQGKTFEQKQKVTVKGDQASYVDPNPILLDNGRIRLYYFASLAQQGDPAKISGKHKIMSTESQDGVTFTNPQLAYEEENITDSDVFQTAKDWRVLVSSGLNLHLAVSNDNGQTFAKQNDFSWAEGAVSNTFNFSGTYRTYFCGKGGIDSATGADIGKLTAEAGIRVEENSKIVCDPSVIQLPDHTFLMFYKVQEITQNNQNNPINQTP